MDLTDRIPDTLGLFSDVSKARTNLASCLNDLLPNVMAMYVKAHGYHWNVVGPDFVQMHSLFSDIYSDVYESIDPLAENVRKLDAFPLGDIGSMASASKVSPAVSSRDSRAMLSDLLRTNDVVLDLIEDALDCAEREQEQGILNFLADRQDMHSKWDWQIRSVLG